MHSHEKFQVLLVEDDPDDALLCVDTIKEAKKSPFTITHTAATLAEALKIIHDGGIDLVLLDLHLPDSKGIETFTKVHAQSPDLPVVVLTGQTDEGRALEIVHQGAQDVLVKGHFDMEVLTRAMRYAIERARTEASLAQEREMIHMLLNNIPDRIYFKDRKSRFVRTNQSLARYFRLKDPEELLGKTDYDFFTEEHARAASEDEQQIMHTGNAVVGKVEKETRPDGTVGWSLTTKMPWVNHRGRIVGTFGISRDITELKAMETALAAERNLIRSVIDNVPDRILLKDTAGRYMLNNVAHARFLGLDDPRQALGRTLGDFLPAEYVTPRREEDEEILRTGKPMVNSIEPMLNAQGARRWLSTTKVPLRDEEGAILGIVIISRDITDQKEAQEKLVEANKNLTEAVTELKKAHAELRSVQLQLIEAEKMKSIGRLAAGVAHEVKNPLAIINMGVAFLSQQKFDGDSEVPVVLREIGDAVKRADAVIKGMLDFSAPKQLEVQDEDLNAIIEQALLLVRGELKPNAHTVVKELQPRLPLLKLDRLKMGQVFVNIFTNALHAMPEGGTLAVRTLTHQHTGVGENIGDARSESFHVGRTLVVAQIDDNGTGIPPDKLHKVFDPFFTTKTTGEGTGLGLSVTRSIVDLHGGTIEIHNRPEGGARVTITFEA
ncbi:MAG TPA: PAS domain-containing protein [Chthoniobacteraceae bacterium]|nr:PAS domain-containing protein [Chthoniobacteraceae bacterium]